MYRKPVPQHPPKSGVMDSQDPGSPPRTPPRTNTNDPEAPKTPEPNDNIKFRRVRSPISLPVRTDSFQTPSTPVNGSPGSQKYFQNFVPTYDELRESMDAPQPILQPRNDSPNNDELIFDDGDERLPPPVPSPTFHAISEPDALAISSPEPELFSPSHFVQREETIVKPKHFLFSPDNNDPSAVSPSDFDLSQSTYYPAPVPVQLMRPPKLRSSRQSKHSNRAMSLNGFSEPPEWGPSLMAKEVEYYRTPDISQNGFDNVYRPQTEEDDDVGSQYDSDIDSDRATVMSSDRDEFESPPLPGSSGLKSRKKKKKWRISNLFSSKEEDLPEAEDETGETYDFDEAKTLLAQMAVIDNDIAFTRLDPETVQRHSQMFDAGGIHGSIAPRSKGTTSLIEEIEIRKAGRRIQQQVFTREVAELERQRAEDMANPRRLAHPADMASQPTLMQMQYMADADYKSRIDWHKRTVNQNYINDHGSETLAQRRARLKAEKSVMPTAKVEETLAQRRLRLRREKEKASVIEV